MILELSSDNIKEESDFACNFSAVSDLLQKTAVVYAKTSRFTDKSQEFLSSALMYNVPFIIFLFLMYLCHYFDPPLQSNKKK